MFPQAVGLKTKYVLEKIAGSEIAGKSYLAGGTALAIQLGHRLSEDLDWFLSDDFAPSAFKAELSRIGVFEVAAEEKGTLHGILDGVRVSFLRYNYGLLFPLVDYETARLADERDIAAMKLDAASSRGSKKDFVDIYFLLQKYSLRELLEIFEKKFAGLNYNKLHILKSLVFFEDAENEPMPVLLKEAGWEEIKKKLAFEANNMLAL